MGKASDAALRCPAISKFIDDNNDSEIDRQSTWVNKKYKYYASRCARTEGVMWKQLTRATHDRVASKVLELFGIYDPQENRTCSWPGMALFDWACGCGVSLNYFARRLEEPFLGVGIDIIEDAIQYANRTVGLHLHGGKHQLLFCQADGTQLGWVPANRFDFITSFGGLLHVPSSAICSTVQHLVRILRPGGTIWAGYIDNMETARLLSNCTVRCERSTNVTVSWVDENKWFKGLGIPKANKKRRPVSVVWKKART